MFYYYSSDDFILMLVAIVAAIFFLNMVRRMANKKPGTTAASTTATTAPKTDKNQMAEDIKATKTSQIVDAVAILDDLGSTSSNYRHYCELVGSSMPSGGVIAPYSKREVAYYDIKCYRLDSVYGGGQRETLVAHEHSIDPFFFKDASCDTPIYVDLESFGNDVILVNSTNHVEGPNSDFAKALKNSAGSSSSRSGTSGAYAMVAQALSYGRNALLGGIDALRCALTPQPVFQPAFALASGGALTSPSDVGRIGSNVMFAQHPGTSDRDRNPSSQQRSGQHRGGGQPQSRGGQPQPRVTIQMGYGPYGHTRPPQHLGDFMGGYGGGPWVMGGGPGYYRPRPSSTDPGDIILGMGLGALLNSLNTTQQQVSSTVTGSTDTFLGYRLVENVVPLNSPVYCIGEIYRSGTNVYMSRSLSKDYPTSYFATKPEMEVLSAIKSK